MNLARRFVRTNATTYRHGMYAFLNGSKRFESTGPAAKYEEGVKEGFIRPDEGQRATIQVLQKMHDELVDYNPPQIHMIDPTKPERGSGGGSFFSGLFGGSGKKGSTHEVKIPSNVPKGLYLYGTVGTGKTFVMDMFYDTIPDKFQNSKLRIHFHQFMIDVHKRLHQFKVKYGDRSDGILYVSQQLAQQARILCFDEFQVTDIVDAMILRQLLESLMSNGVVCVMTSNRAPDELYENGIQRDQFIPAIELIKKRFVVRWLGSGVDYRKIEAARQQVYFYPINKDTRAIIDGIWDDLVKKENQPVSTDRTVEVWGRHLPIPEACGKAARFTFDQLCKEKRSAADYIGITNAFQWIVLTDVPQLGINEADYARRLILFIDAAYEARTKLFILAQVPPEQVLDYGDSKDVDESAFAFDRAVSRISEMSKVSWLKQ